MQKKILLDLNFSAEPTMIEFQEAVLRALNKYYPKVLTKKQIEKSLPTISGEDIERALQYSIEKGFVRRINMSVGFQALLPTATDYGYRLTAEGIDYIQAIEPGGFTATEHPTTRAEIVEKLEQEREIQPAEQQEKEEQTVKSTAEKGALVSAGSKPLVDTGSRMIDEMDKINNQITTKFQEIRKEQDAFQRQFLGRIIEIFGIFVAIFTIVILTINVTTKISPTMSFEQLLYFSTAMYLPPVVAIVVLVGVIRLIVHK